MRLACVYFAIICSCFGQFLPQRWIRLKAFDFSPSEVKPLVDMICPGQVTTQFVTPTDSRPGCAVCPDGTVFAGSAGWALDAVFTGHFLSALSDDALVSGSGCEPHAAGVSQSYLFTRDGSSWRRIRYFPSLNAYDCRDLLGTDGRDRLVCASSDAHQGYASVGLFLLDIKAAAQASANTDEQAGIAGFFSLDDSTGMCMPLPDGTVKIGQMQKVEFTSLPDANHVRITAVTREGQTTAVPRLLEEHCEKGTPLPESLSQERRHNFVFDGAKIVPGIDQ